MRNLYIITGVEHSGKCTYIRNNFSNKVPILINREIWRIYNNFSNEDYCLLLSIILIDNDAAITLMSENSDRIIEFFEILKHFCNLELLNIKIIYLNPKDEVIVDRNLHDEDRGYEYVEKYIYKELELRKIPLKDDFKNFNFNSIEIKVI